MKRYLLFFVLLISLLLIVLPAAAQVFVPGVDTDPQTLIIDYHRVQVDIENQIATTHIDFQFTNIGERLAEGTLIFPLPAGAAVENLTMWVDGQPYEAKILEAEEARAIYNETVRRLADPALLEYVGMNAVQASVFPIPPGESRRVEVTYSYVLEVDNGLLKYSYPVQAVGLRRAVDQMAISVNVISNDPISNIYSPSHNIAITRADDNLSFRAGFEAANYVPEDDFTLYYGVESDTINVNLLTYRESANQDGFFMLLVQPPISLPDDAVIAKDVIIVLDQSGSMLGEKWDQARAAAAYVLENLNPEDRFNVITFSTGWRTFSMEMEPVREAEDAIAWINTLYAEGGTDINGALTTALNMADTERPTTILFLTDGLATEGVIESDAILANLEAAAKPNVRIFTFGVGDDVDTFLLDAIVRDHHGASSYVRPNERIDEEVASLYNKISAPVLTDVALTIDGVQAELMYPQQLNDLFAGEQLTIVGRYRGNADNATITLSGTVRGQEQNFTYSGLSFRENAGGEPFIARLWATRRIGDLLNTIRLNGESEELVNSVVSLSIRYGIITPYTSFLIDENDILSQEGRQRAEEAFAAEAEDLAAEASGAQAVAAADASSSLANAQAAPAAPQQPVGQAGGGGAFPAPMATSSPAGAMLPPAEPMDEDGEVSTRMDDSTPIQFVNDKTFLLIDGVWTDTAFEPDTMETQKVVFLSDAYFDLLAQIPELADYFALGERVIVVYDGIAYEVTAE